jgi:hypothetical protein
MQIIRFTWELSHSGQKGNTVREIPCKAGIWQATWTANRVFTKPIALIARIDRGHEE